MNHIDRILDKIKKCLALSESANENEATIALQQAQKLMESHGLSSIDVKLSSIKESETRSSTASRPPIWESYLANLVGKAFECESLHKKSWDYQNRRKIGHWLFLGVEHRAEVASYTFEVLYRQLKKARHHFKQQLPLNTARSDITRYSDLFAISWVESVSEKVTTVAPKETRDLIKKYKETKLDMSEKPMQTSNRVGRVSEDDMFAIYAGQVCAQDVNLHHGMSREEVLKLS